MSTLEKSCNDWDVLARSFGYSDEYDMLHELYEVEQASISDIAERIGVSFFAVSSHLERCHIEKRKQGGPNRGASQMRKLFYSDQRVILFSTVRDLHSQLQVSKALLYKYRRVFEL